jgi:hypothetical protein
MSYQEKQALVAVFTHIFGSIAYFYYRFQSLDFNAQSDSQFWASTILLYLLILILVRIIVYIIFSIMNTIITRENEPHFSDEMDRLIDLRATTNFYHIFAIGFFLSLGTQVLNWPPAAMFIGFILSMVIGGIVAEASNFYFYRRGV